MSTLNTIVNILILMISLWLIWGTYADHHHIDHTPQHYSEVLHRLDSVQRVLEVARAYITELERQVTQYEARLQVINARIDSAFMAWRERLQQRMNEMNVIEQRP